MVNQLRYPNTHTFFASALLLHSFAPGQADDLSREIIVRVLLERVCSLRPHPFGLVLTQVELLRKYKVQEEAFFQKQETAILKPLIDRIQSAAAI